jgi:hypothetical protein
VAAVVVLGATASALAVVPASGTRITAIEVRTETGRVATTNSSVAPKRIPGAFAVVTVPEGGRIRARFSAVTTCGGQEFQHVTTGAECNVKILLSPTVLGDPGFQPAVVTFDSYDGVCCDDRTPTARSFEWISTRALPAGSYEARAWFFVGPTHPLMEVGPWTFTVEVIAPA